MNLVIIAMLISYFLFILVIGVYARAKTKETPEDYYLANRRFSTGVLFFTLAATNFSAFTFLGFSGRAYTDGLGQYGIMALGTSFMALMFFVIGKKVWKIGKEKKYVTPGQLLGGRYNSRILQVIVAIVMSTFTIPYLATQAIGAGYILRMIFPDLSLKLGAILVIIIICIYVVSGGMKASGWTDVMQGVIMICAMIIAFAFIVNSLGGFDKISTETINANSQLYERPGPLGYFTPQIWFSFFILWIFCDPMFPQIFSRFYTAHNQKSLKNAMVLYPLLISFLFLIPVLIGVWANGTSLVVDNPDNVLLLMVEKFTPLPIFSFIIIGALAALMSTADSQLLSISTIVTYDIFNKRKISYSKILTVSLTLFAILFVLVGYNPKTGIMGTLITTTFSGLVVLFPSFFATLYWKKATELGCISSIIIGEIVVLAYTYFSLPTFGFLSSIIALLVSAVIMIIVSLLTYKKRFLRKIHLNYWK